MFPGITIGNPEPPVVAVEENSVNGSAYVLCVPRAGRPSTGVLPDHAESAMPVYSIRALASVRLIHDSSLCASR